MNKFTKNLLLSFIATLVLAMPTITFGIEIRVTVRGIEDTDGVTSLSISNGNTVVIASRSDSGHTEESTTIWVQDGVDENTGEPYGHEETIVTITNQWTNYDAGVSDVWMGQSVCFSLDGSEWSALHLLLSAPSSFQCDVADIGGNPFSGTATDPNSNVTIQGNTIAIGKWWNDSERSVFSLTAWDNALPSWPCVGMEINASTENAYWRWVHPGSVAMELDYLHRLTVRGRNNASKRIVLEPELGRILIDSTPVVTTANAATQLATQFVSRTDSRVGFGSGATVRATQSADQQVGQLVLGKYNDNTTDAISGNHLNEVLVVGTGSGLGTGPTARKNGLRILDNGTVLILPAGDLQMAEEFREGPQP